MKNCFTLLGWSLFLLASNHSFAQDQTPDGGFESWENITIKDSVEHWFSINTNPSSPNVSHIDDGFEGDAVRIETVADFDGEALEGAIILAASVGDESFEGYPYTSDVTTLHAHLRYNMEPTDTGFAMVILENDGTPFSFDVFPIYDTQDTWEAFEWELSSPLLTPTGVTIAFFSGGHGESTPVNGSWIEVDNVYFEDDGSTPDALPNYSFEDWTAVELEVNSEWYTLDPIINAFLGFNNIYKSADATEGTYSVQLETYAENVEEEVIPFITNGEFDFETEEIIGGTAFDGSPMLYKGDYKFASAADDSAFVYLKFWNTTGDEVEYADTLSPTDDWAEFSIAVDLDFTPDSVLVVLTAGYQEDAIINYDNTRFVYDDVSVPEEKPISISTYPNPANDYLKIKLNAKTDLVITDMTGKAVHTEIQADSFVEINTAHWPEGIYLIQVFKANSFETERLVIQH